MQKYKCSKCKEYSENVIKYSYMRDKQYYNCNPCNTERIKKYRRTELGRENSTKAAYKYMRKVGIMH